MNGKITVVYDEGALPDTDLIGAIGMSILIEADGKRTLFGLGHRPRYLDHNMYSLGIDPDSIDQVVVSHGHVDHYGGIAGLLKHRERPVDVYAPASAWGEKKTFGSTGVYLPEEYAGLGVRKDVTGWTQLSEHVWISEPVSANDAEECFMCLRTATGTVMIVGCCHPGLDHMFESEKEKFGRYPTVLIGGLHIGKKNDRLADVYAHYLKDSGCKLYLNHCTDARGINRMRVTLGLDGVKDFFGGQTMDLQLL